MRVQKEKAIHAALQLYSIGTGVAIYLHIHIVY
jgi:hypothetical protein